MQYKIPQNVQIEDKIVGPLTLRQLIICGIGGGITYFVYLSLAKVYYIEVWIGPVAILGLFTLAIAFLKIHDIPFLKYILLVIEYSQNAQKRKWMSNGSNIKGLTSPNSVQVPLSTKAKATEKTIASLSDLSRLLDHNTFDHVKSKVDQSLDSISDEYLLHKSFTGKDESDIKEHIQKLNAISKKSTQELDNSADALSSAGEKIIHMHELKKGNIEIKVPRK